MKSMNVMTRNKNQTIKHGKNVMPKITPAIRSALYRCGMDPTLTGTDLLEQFMFTKTGKVRPILGKSAKTEKGNGAGYYTAIAYLAPAKLAGINLCPFATDGCAAACLAHSTGNLKFPANQRVQVIKALWFHLFRDAFIETVKAEIRLKDVQARALGKVCAIRLNGSTDIQWERYIDTSEFPNVWFYDYTKFPVKARDKREHNYHLTYSYSEDPNADKRAKEWLDAGGNVAVVVAGPKGSKLAAAKKAAKHIIQQGFKGYPVLDGDKNDARFDDKPGHWVALYAKGEKAQADSTGFVQRIDA